MASRSPTPTRASDGESHVALTGAFGGLMVGVLVGLLAAGDQLFLPVLYASLGVLVGAALALAAQHTSRARRGGRPEVRPVDPERWERRMAAHRAIAELEQQPSGNA